MTHFDPKILEGWLRAWLVLEGNQQHLANALTKASEDQVEGLEGKNEIDAFIVQEALSRFRQGMIPSDGGLLALLAVVLRAECAYRRAGVNAKSPRARSESGQEYVLMPMAETLLRALSMNNGLAHEFDKIPASNFVLGLRRLTGLEMRWVKLKGDISISPAPMQDLVWNQPAGSPIRFGVASWIDACELNWKLDIVGSVVKGRSQKFIRCLGSPVNSFESLKVRLLAVLKAAIKDNVHVLVLPELTIDERLLTVLKGELANAGRTKLGNVKLVVAGSSHFQTDADGYVNRTVALSGWGKVLWVQDKLVPFVIRREKVHYREPRELGSVLRLRESRTLGRIAMAICSDLCISNAGAVGAMCESMVSLCLVPSMQSDGQLGRLEESARMLQRSHWGSTVVSNVLVTDDGKGKKRPTAESSDFARAADSDANEKSTPSEFTPVLRYYDLHPISSQLLVNYKLDE